MPFVVDHTIPRQPEDVWRIMTDWKVAEYWLGVNRLRLAKPGQTPKTGSQLTYLVRGMPQPMQITDWKPPERLGLSSRQAGIVVEYRYELTAVEAGTRIQLESKCAGDNWFWRGVAPFLEWTMRVADRKQLPALDKLVRLTTGSGT
jgi:uncharacterized protein YndB with AHSA1/START domain